MFELSIDCEFCAAHAIMIRGVREPVHGHNWHVTATVAGERLDEDQLLCDFHELHGHLDAIIAPLRNGDLNATPPFDRVNPSAEAVARHVGDALRAMQLPALTRAERVRAFEEANLPIDGRLSLASLVRVGHLVLASDLIVGTVRLSGEELVIDARRIRLDTGRLVEQTTDRAPLPGLDEAERTRHKGELVHPNLMISCSAFVGAAAGGAAGAWGAAGACRAAIKSHGARIDAFTWLLLSKGARRRRWPA